MDKSMEKRKYDLEERLTDLAVMIIGFVESMPNTKAANHLSGQQFNSSVCVITDRNSEQVSLLVCEDTDQGAGEKMECRMMK